jgi:hypothetical protein
MDRLRLRRLRLSPQALLFLFGPGDHRAYRLLADPVPADAVILGAQMVQGEIVLTLASSEFEQLGNDANPPDLIPVCEAF